MKVPRGTGHPDRGARAPCGATDLAHQDAPNPEAVPGQRNGPCATIPPTYSGREAAVRNRKSGRGSRSLPVSHANRREGSHFNCVKIIYLPPRAHAGPMLHKHVEIRRSRSRESHREGRTRGPNRHEQHTPRTGRFAEQNLAAVGLAGRTPWWGHGAAVRGDPSAPDLPDTRVIGRQPAASCGVLPSSSGPRAAPVGATTPPNCSEAPPDLRRPTPMPDRGP